MKKRKSILLVDDDPVANYLHINLLDNLKVAEKIDIVTNGEEACKFISSFGDPELILLDLHMPVMDGILFLGTFRKLFPASKSEIFILTSSEHKNDIADCENWGINGYIIKPLTESKIKDILENNHNIKQEEKDFFV